MRANNSVFKFEEALTWILHHLPVDSLSGCPRVHVVPQSVAGDYEEVLGAVQGDASDLRLAGNERLVRDVAWKKKKSIEKKRRIVKKRQEK